MQLVILWEPRLSFVGLTWQVHKTSARNGGIYNRIGLIGEKEFNALLKLEKDWVDD